MAFIIMTLSITILNIFNMMKLILILTVIYAQYNNNVNNA
jgi:hypothetical protein